MQVSNPGENPRRRALLQALEEAQERFDALPFNSLGRCILAQQIVDIEDALVELGE